VIIQGQTPEEAQSRLQAFLQPAPTGEHPATVKIGKISAAQFVDDLLAESGNAPLDLPKIAQEVQNQMESTTPDDLGHGFWADANAMVRPEKLAGSIEALRDGLPQDICAGLNWTPERKYVFVLTVFSAAEPGLLESPGAEEPPPADQEEPDESSDLQNFGVTPGLFAELRDKEAVAVIQARNSVVAAWLWRQYAAGSRLAANEIRVDCWPGMLTESSEN